MADVTKELLLKIGTTGAQEASDVLKGLDGGFVGIAMGITGINSAFELFNKALGAVKTGIGYVTAAGADLIATASTFEQLGIRFETIFGGAGPAQKALDWATNFAAITPLTLEEVTSRMLKLKTYGFDPMNGMLETIGNAAYALGADFDGIVVALGQMQLKGRVVQQELNQLAERGVPAAKWLQEAFGLTADQMRDIGRQGIEADKAIQVILSRMNTEYAGAMKRAGDTWVGAMSTIMDTWTIFEKRIMDNGPFAFLLANIRMVRDDFSKWIDGPGANLAWRIAGMMTDWLKNGKSLLLDDIIPGVKMAGEAAYNMLLTITPFWNRFLDFSGAVVGPVLAGVTEILKLTGFLGQVGDVAFNALMAAGKSFLTWSLQSINDIWGRLQLGWLDFKTAVFLGLYELERSIASMITSVATSPGVIQLMSGLGLGDEITRLANWAIDAGKMAQKGAFLTNRDSDAEVSLIQQTTSIYNKAIKEAVNDLSKLTGIFDSLKINGADPFGLSRVLKDTTGETGRIMWEQNGNQNALERRTLWDNEKDQVERLNTAGGAGSGSASSSGTGGGIDLAAGGKELRIIFDAGTGDELALAFAKVLTRKSKADGLLVGGW